MKVLNFEDSVYKANAIRKVLNQCGVAKIELVSNVEDGLQMLKNAEDTLYILGDVVDRGPEPMKILKYMMAHSNIIPIIGNHEVMALPNLKLLVPEVSRNFLDKLPTKVYRDFDNWTQNGSTSTIQDFRKLPQEERHQVVEYMKSFHPYGKEIVNGQEYWLVHAGLDHFSETKHLEEYSVDDLVWTRIDYEIPYFNDIIVVSGIHRHRISLGTTA